MHLVPAEGPHRVPDLLRLTSRSAGSPCTQFHPPRSKPEFTPEPDMIHDCLRHVPRSSTTTYAEAADDDRQAAVRATSGRPRARVEAAELVLDRIRAHRREAGRHAHLSAPASCRRTGEIPVLAVGRTSSAGRVVRTR